MTNFLGAVGRGLKRGLEACTGPCTGRRQQRYEEVDPYEHGPVEGLAFGKGALREPNPLLDGYRTETHKPQRQRSRTPPGPRVAAFGEGALRKWH